MLDSAGPNVPARSQPQAEISQWPRSGQIALAAVVVGVIVRLENLLGGRSVHIDEARLALNIGQRSFLELAEPLSYEQTAPIPFLWIEKLSTVVGGVNDLVLRLFPFVVGCILLIFVYGLARRLLPDIGAVLVASLAAVSPVLVHYSNEIKPYILDTLFAVVLTQITLDLIAKPSKQTWRKFATVGSLAVLSSIPAILVLSGLCAVIFGARYRSDRRLVISTILTLTAWIAVFTALYWAFYRTMSTHPYMRHFWEPAFLTAEGGPVLPRTLAMLNEVMWGTFMGGYVHGVKDPVINVTVGVAAAALAMTSVAGLWYLLKQNDVFAVGALVAPAGVTVGASIIGAYPISLRLVLYLVPVVMILVISGVLYAIDRASPVRRSVFLVAVMLALLVRPALRSTVPRFWPYHRQDLRELVQYIQTRNVRDPIYVFANSAPAWVYYTTDWSSPDTARLNWYARVASADGPAFENASPRKERVANEGAGLEYQYNGVTELVGVSTGEQWRVLVGSKGHPDAGWAENEAQRIVSRADPAVWLVFSHYRGSENYLLDMIEAAGLRQIDNVATNGARIFRYAR